LILKKEDECFFKQSTLTEKSLFPNNTERQNVALVLKVFSDMTSSALKTSEFSTQSMQETAECIDIILDFWKLVNCKTPVEHIRFRELRRIAIDKNELGDRSFDVLFNMAMTVN
jgi:hypothetical protein